VIPPNQFVVVALRGVAPHKAELVFPITTGSPDGSVTRYTGGFGTTNQAAIIYAGFTPKQPHSGGTSWIRISGAGLLVVMGNTNSALCGATPRNATTTNWLGGITPPLNTTVGPFWFACHPAGGSATCRSNPAAMVTSTRSIGFP